MTRENIESISMDFPAFFPIKACGLGEISEWAFLFDLCTQMWRGERSELSEEGMNDVVVDGAEKKISGQWGLIRDELWLFF